MAYNVYFDTAGLGLAGGNVTVEWTGSYLDAATGNYFINYLYLNDNYLEGVATNDGVLGDIPFNFTFTESPTKLIYQAAAAAGFYNVFPAGTLTNRYAYVNAQLVRRHVCHQRDCQPGCHQSSGPDPDQRHQRVELALAKVNGPNYMSLQSTNQFDGSPGASIQVPYSDLNLGVTNGFLTISNLLTPQIPVWSGSCQAWSTRWTTTVSNLVGTNVITVTNDYRVLIVGSQVTPTTVAQVQDMILHGTNSIVVSDALNIMRTFTADAQSLTLTTNGPGYGATSVDGELNVASGDIFWASALPNLLNLTNNGAIRFQNLSQFIGNSNHVWQRPPWRQPPRSRKSPARTNVHAGNYLSIGTNTYYFETNLTNTFANQIKIAAQFDGTMSNLIAAINRTNGAGTGYSTNTTTNAFVTAGRLTSHAFTVTATTNGSIGDSIQLKLSGYTTNLTWSSSYLTNGVDGSTNVTPIAIPYHNFINNGLLSDQGSQIWATNFESSGAISNGVGLFILQSQTTTLTNGQIVAGGAVSITTGSLVASNLALEADQSLTLVVTNRSPTLA